MKYNNYKKEGTNTSYYRKSGGALDIGSGIAAIKEVRGKSIVWNQKAKILANWSITKATGSVSDGVATILASSSWGGIRQNNFDYLSEHKYYCAADIYTETATNLIQIIGHYVGAVGAVVSGWRRISGIGTVKSTERSVFGVVDKRTTDWDEFKVKNAVLLDLTLMFGAGNEPSSVVEFEKMFPLDYYDYNAGEVIPFAGQNLVTTGFNLFNQDAFYAGKSGIIKEGDYFVGNSSNFLGTFFDNRTFKFDGRFTISLDGITPASSALYLNIYYSDGTNGGYLWIGNGHKTFVTASDKVVSRISFSYGVAYNNVKVGNICISFQSDKDGTYEPYEKHTLPLDPSQWRDKQGNLVFPYGGMHGVGTAYDYAKVDADGYIRKAVRVFEQVDLGSFNWDLSMNNTFFATIGDTLGQTSKGICSRYPVIYTSYPPDSSSIQDDKVVVLSRYGGPCSGRFGVRDSSYNDAATFKTAMQGVHLIYELATPVEVELATPIYAKYLVDKDGTEEITPANGTTPYTTPPDMDVTYNNDVAKIIKGANTPIQKVYKGVTLIWEKPQ